MMYARINPEMRYFPTTAAQNHLDETIRLTAVIATRDKILVGHNADFLRL